jgi:hypothetical protein
MTTGSTSRTIEFLLNCEVFSSGRWSESGFRKTPRFGRTRDFSRDAGKSSEFSVARPMFGNRRDHMKQLEHISAAERMQISIGQKTQEGTRLLALFGALGAVPAGALVLGAESAPGAPLFCLALLGVFAGYMFWGYTDAVYHIDTLLILDGEELEKLHRDGYRWQRACIAYGIITVSCTFAGFAAVYSDLRTPFSVSVGFLAIVPATALSAIHIIRASTERNNWIMFARKAGEQLLAESHRVAAEGVPR